MFLFLIKAAAMCWAIANIIGFVLAAILLAGLFALIAWECYRAWRRKK